MEHETGRAVLPGLAKLMGAGALVAFATGYWYLALPCAAVVVLCIVQLRRWDHRELEERARRAEAPTAEEEAAAAEFAEEHGWDVLDPAERDAGEAGDGVRDGDGRDGDGDGDGPRGPRPPDGRQP